MPMHLPSGSPASGAAATGVWTELAGVGFGGGVHGCSRATRCRCGDRTALPAPPFPVAALVLLGSSQLSLVDLYEKLVDVWRRLALGPLGSQNKREVLSDVDWTVRERRVRNVTHGRLHIIEHLEHGFRHSRPAAVMAAKSRAKSRTLWGSGRGELEKPLGSGRGGPGAADEAAARAIADKLKGKAARLTGNNLQSRLVTAGKSERWAERLVGALPGAGAGAQGAPQEAGAGEVLRAAWEAAANPSGRTARGIKGGRARVDEVAAELTTALPPRESSGMDIDEVGG